MKEFSRQNRDKQRAPKGRSQDDSRAQRAARHLKKERLAHVRERELAFA